MRYIKKFNESGKFSSILIELFLQSNLDKLQEKMSNLDIILSLQYKFSTEIGIFKDIILFNNDKKINMNYEQENPIAELDCLIIQIKDIEENTIIDVEKELQYKDQQTDVGEDPMKNTKSNTLLE